MHTCDLVRLWQHQSDMKKATTVDGGETISYTLRDIPKEIWRKARIRGIQQDLEMKDVLLGLLRAYAQGKVEPKVD